MPSFTAPDPFVLGQDVDPPDLNRLNTMIDELQDFAVGVGWTYLPPNSGYVTSTQTPVVRKEGARVYAAGRISGTMTGTVTIATIPVGFRPTAATAPPGFDYYSAEVPCGTSRARCRIYADGSVIIDNMTTTGTQVVDLSALSWPVP